MKHFLFFLLVILHAGLVPAQKVDSLIQLLDNADGEIKLKLLDEITDAALSRQVKNSFEYSDQGIQLAKELNDKESELKFLFYKGWAHALLNNPDSVKSYINFISNQLRIFNVEKGQIYKSLLEARILRNEENYNEGINVLSKLLVTDLLDDEPVFNAKVMNELGSIHRRLSNNDEALKYHNRALEILKLNNNENELVSTYTYLGILHAIIGNYDEALKFYHLALKHNQMRNDTRGIAGSIHNIGIIYQKLEQFDKSLEYYEQALKYWNELGNKGGLASTLNSIGAVKELQKDLNSALNYYQQALEIWEKIDNESSTSIALNNIASIYEQLGNYSQGLAYITRAIDSREKVGDKNGLASSLLVRAEIYNKLNNYVSALNDGKRGLELALESNSWSTIREAHSILASIYENNGMFKEALAEHKLYKAAHDSMFNTESQETIAELETKYESENQKRQIEILQRDKELQTLYNSALFAGFLAVVVISLLLFNRYRLKHKAHKTLKQLHETEMESADAKAKLLQIEFEQKKKELEDARRLQLSMLPAKLPAHPQIEIAAAMITATEVGGDYYDFCENTHGEITIAIGDATGHGAQAGTMVTATKSLFNLLSREDDIAGILNKLSFALKKMNLPNMFMAMALVKFRKDEIELAGAGMPPALIYRSSSGTVETISLKGLPLGVTDYTYSKTKIKLESGDTVMLMSDGLPELFNDKNEMFGYENLNKLLETSGKSTPEEIITYFSSTAVEWTAGNRQQDDMTFIVFRKK
ncbi:MAG: tetratricopeptide repeat protein [Ignavibacteriales bacterium]|nr:MAG: tetratricopeptide repeat protein [Ignavibacteriales bacterium]